MAYRFNSRVGQAQPPPQPGFFRFATALAINPTAARATTTSAAMVWNSGDMIEG